MPAIAEDSNVKNPLLAHIAALHNEPDPVIAELHETRERLYAQYNGDLHAYSKAATANALALGFKFYVSPVKQLCPINDANPSI